MKIKIQESVPYKDSLKWKIQDNYYQQRGINAWKSFEVPYDITSNYQAACQNARVVFEAVKNIYHRKETFYILEIASGAGIFALNFLQAFENICRQEGKDFDKNIHYMVSDFSEKNLTDLSDNPNFIRLRKENRLDFYIVDALNISTMKKLDGEPFALENEMIDVVITNYLHCCLPQEFLKKEIGKYFQRKIALVYNTDENEPDKSGFSEQEIAGLIENPARHDLLDRIEDVAEYEEIDLQSYISDETEREVILEAFETSPSGITVYPYGSFRNIRTVFPYLNKGGIMLISDKAYANHCNCNENNLRPSIHGNSFAHNLDTELIGSFAGRFGLSSLRTADPTFNLQTILMVKTDEVENNLSDAFKENFIENNLNEEAYLHDHAAVLFHEKNNLDLAIKYYQKALKLNPKNNRSYCHIARCYYQQKNYAKALEYFQAGKEHSYPGMGIDFDFEIGKCLYVLEKYQEATDYFHQSLLKFGEREDTFYNLGLCLMYQDNIREAYVFFDKALKLNPGYENSIKAINLLKETVFKQWLDNFPII